MSLKKHLITSVLGLSVIFSPLASAMGPVVYGHDRMHHGYNHRHHQQPAYGWFNRPWFHRAPPRVVVIRPSHHNPGIAIIKHRRGVEVHLRNGRY